MAESITNISINNVILYLMLILMCIAGLDRCFGNKLKLGQQFEEGFMASGALALSMVGAICIAPALGDWLSPIIAPVYKLFGASPAMFATTLLANDMGGYNLALSLAGTDVDAGNFAGLILGAMMGPTVVFTIPVALGIIKVEDRVFLARGVLIGIITIPLGCFVGGLVAGYPAIWMIKNLLPVIVFAILVALGLAFLPKLMINGFLWFGKFVIAFLTISLMIAGFQGATGTVIIKNMTPIDDAFAVVGSIVVILAGAFTLVYLLTKFFGKPLEKVGSLLGMNEVAAAGMVASLANSIAMFNILKDMDDRGKVINISFAVSGAFVFGDHLGFTAGVNPEMITPMVVGKLVAGISAVIIAVLVLPKNIVYNSRK